MPLDGWKQGQREISNCGNPAGIYLLKGNNRNTRTKCEICSKLIIKILERHLSIKSCISHKCFVFSKKKCTRKIKFCDIDADNKVAMPRFLNGL